MTDSVATQENDTTAITPASPAVEATEATTDEATTSPELEHADTK